MNNDTKIEVILMAFLAFFVSDLKQNKNKESSHKSNKLSA